MFAQLLKHNLACDAAFLPRRVPVFEEIDENKYVQEPQMIGFELEHYAMLCLITENNDYQVEITEKQENKKKKVIK